MTERADWECRWGGGCRSHPPEDIALLGLSSSFSWVDLLDLFRTVPLFRIFCRAASWIHAASTNHFLSRKKGLLSVSNGENV